VTELTTRKEALEYHSQGRPGKIEIVASKPCLTQIDLSLAYTPGVAEPCREIAEDTNKVFDYTARGNLIAVVTDGSAVLGLGNIGPEAAKPVMEGKAVLFKRFADIDVIDLELGTQDVDEIVAAVKAIEPTVSGINLEDISAPRCFEVERRLQEELSIPVFHDDQHGTAVITGAALMNALQIAEKRIEDVIVVVNGAGAAAIACTDLVVSLGVTPENVLMCDSKGVLHTERTEGLNEYKARFVRETDRRSLADAMEGSDVFIGVSVADTVTPEMLLSMAENPIVLAMANPDPEIPYPLAVETRSDVIMATGRSDYPNQVNNVLGFPFIFRGALDVRATCINTEMLHAAVQALAELAQEPVPKQVARAYDLEEIEFGREYLIPKPLDHRVIRRVARAVAAAAMESGVAGKEIEISEYTRQLGERMGEQRDLMRRAVSRARNHNQRIVYPEGEEARTIIAAECVVEEHIARPILVGDPEVIHQKAEELGTSMKGIEIVDPNNNPNLEEHVSELCDIRAHRELTREGALAYLKDSMWLAPLLVRMGQADGMVAGVTRRVRKTMSPMLKVLRLQEGATLAAGMTIIFPKTGPLFLADTGVNIQPNHKELAEIARLASEQVKAFGIEPRVAMLSFSSFGGTPHPRSTMVRRAVELARELSPDLIIDGEMRADCALDPLIQAKYPDCQLGGKPANVLIPPSLEAANIAFNLLRTVGDLPTVGPITLGLAKPAHMLQPHSRGVKDIVHLTAIASLSPAPARRPELLLS